MLSAATPSFAFDTTELLGKWIHKGAKSDMIVEFTPTSMSFYPVGPDRKPLAPPQPTSVTYRLLGDTIGIDLGPGPGFIVLPHDHDTITLDIPGLFAHRLIRLRP
ncbi:hypothetical protein FM996_13695 [Methylosinus sporium]|uniref:Uncharacterized protein n=1 Tax=Methylosinus sporium TaxID=428 RepID=A0A549SP64_METSR|nr:MULTISPECIES: hypothetical protein [Methylosinus]MBU3887498.1 hypothetical protein [Methylosinus sp. KRF6]TRL31419.1 hypothetical protein FM996_13695 [Methylosinus sporium]